jgi:hypothetical protein
MPNVNTQFADTLYCANGTITVNGPLGIDDDDAPHKVVVFAFVTQHQPASGNGNKAKAQNVTVAGEAQLFPADDAKWWLVCPVSTIRAPQDTVPPAAAKRHQYRYTFEGSDEWSFKTARSGLVTGPAFGTAVRLDFKDNGTIETYAWSGWVEIAESGK